MAIPTTSILLDAQAVLIKAGVRAGATVADLGCGATGHFVIPAAKMVGANGKVYAVDILKSVLAGVESRARLEGIVSLQTIWGDCDIAKGSGIADNSVDVVLVVNNLYQTKVRSAFLSEAKRIAKSGGKIVVIDWKTVASPLGPPAESRISAEAAKIDAADAGLKLMEAWEPGPYFWGLIFTK